MVTVRVMFLWHNCTVKIMVLVYGMYLNRRSFCIYTVYIYIYREREREF